MKRQRQLTVFETARAGLVKVKALMFFASALLQTKFIEDPTCNTAWTDMVVIGYNPAFIEGLDVPTAKFVIIHELMHILLKHGLRRGNRDPGKWNEACDYAINIMLKKLGFSIWKFALIEPKYDGMTAEQIYAARQQQGSKGKKGQGQGQDQGQGRQSKPGQQQGTAVPAMGQPAPTPEQGGLGGDLRPVPVVTPEQAAAIDHEISKVIARATAIAKTHGVMPGELEAIIGSTYEDPVPWEQVLIDYMTACLGQDEN